ncbi:MAG: threonylcarbamoyl-AMP synthase [Burkholderiaceae bacterium]|nr:threonylcarbamoyl-AMP synthase [Rhodoferax sp.]MCP5287331.1 threonylcarbamoyl-AMP synthase [Burkholderiaceae bacterium]
MPVMSGQDAQAVATAARLLADGQLVALPTETVYGLGARADDDAAVARIYAAKERPADHPLIVHVADADSAAAFCADPGPVARALMARFWPGPLTLILPRRAGVANAAAGGQDSIGLRCPAHPVAQALLRAAARLNVVGIAAPSANRFGRVSPTCAEHVASEFGPGLWVLDGGWCDVGVESTIVDCTRMPAALLRPGGVSRDRIEAALGAPLATPDAQRPRASGTLPSHYAPRARVRLFRDAEAITAAIAAEGAATSLHTVAVYSRSLSAVPGAGVLRSMPVDPEAAAHELFAVLRELDAAGVAEIWVEHPPADVAWEAVTDRLRRAAA